MKEKNFKMDRVIQERLETIGQTLETQVDDQIAKFENMKVDDLQAIRDEIQKKRKARMELEKQWKDMVSIIILLIGIVKNGYYLMWLIIFCYSGTWNLRRVTG